ncbi:arylesterase [Thalassospira xiamenensis]|uniref:Acyl-CoA thioesterase-1 n=1 Tax=Thalassospira xiamenensis TaxID=220697 RepID=A0A285T4P6_9PROT|nr:arylesterase [Thalassospira xiamenensis]SOC16125.1 acyl-CoA thioesterase-1 [Thalassospira xiamenensis]
MAYTLFGQDPAVNQFTFKQKTGLLGGLSRRLFRCAGMAFGILIGAMSLFGIHDAQAADKAADNAANSASGNAPQTLMLYGDSLMAGYGLSHEDGFAPRLEAALRDAGHNVKVINSSVSGDTTAAGLSRLEWALVDDPDIVLLELGANDALRGVEPSQTRENLDAIIGKLRDRDVAVLLAGMMAPPNMGKEYGAEFNEIYPELAAEYQLAFYPFFLDGVAADSSLNQDDGIHPNADGVKVIVERILPQVINVLEADS